MGWWVPGLGCGLRPGGRLEASGGRAAQAGEQSAPKAAAAAPLSGSGGGIGGNPVPVGGSLRAPAHEPTHVRTVNSSRRSNGARGACLDILTRALATFHRSCAVAGPMRAYVTIHRTMKVFIVTSCSAGPRFRHAAAPRNASPVTGYAVRGGRNCSSRANTAPTHEHRRRALLLTELVVDSTGGPRHLCLCGQRRWCARVCGVQAMKARAGGREGAPRLHVRQAWSRTTAAHWRKKRGKCTDLCILTLVMLHALPCVGCVERGSWLTELAGTKPLDEC